MKNVQIDFFDGTNTYPASVTLVGITRSWVARVTIEGHPEVKQMHINYRLGEYITPFFGRQSLLDYFSPLFDEIEETAAKLLPEEETIES